MFAGFSLLLLGAALTYAPGLFSWFGKLPGDIHIKNDNGQIFIPITTMIVISVVVSLLLNFFLRK